MPIYGQVVFGSDELETMGLTDGSVGLPMGLEYNHGLRKGLQEGLTRPADP